MIDSLSNHANGLDTTFAERQSASRAETENPQRFIENLFVHLLGRSTFDGGEIAYWTDYLLQTGNPIDVFNRFLASQEYQTRLEKLNNLDEVYPPGHFYSPLVNLTEILAERDRVFTQRALVGIDLKPDNQERLFEALSTYFPSLPFSDSSNGRQRYYYGNTSFGFGDACIYWALLGLVQPSRIVEVGSGYTSALALDAIDHFGLQTHCTFVDPYPELLLRVTEPRDRRHAVVDRPIQLVGVDLVATLRTNDLLFIDSSHVLKTGSDVAYELTEMLPRLRSGVIVHFHDVFYPFEYPEKWVIEEKKSWNELYALQSFLLFNRDFEIIFFNDYFAKHREDLVRLHAGPVAARFLLNAGGGLWLRRK